MSERTPAFIGYASRFTNRTDLSELYMCKERPERCTLPPGEHERQRLADIEWRKNNL